MEARGPTRSIIMALVTDKNLFFTPQPSNPYYYENYMPPNHPHRADRPFFPHEHLRPKHLLYRRISQGYESWITTEGSLYADVETYSVHYYDYCTVTK